MPINVSFTEREANLLIALAYYRDKQDGYSERNDLRSIIAKIDEAGKEVGVELYLP